MKGGFVPNVVLRVLSQYVNTFLSNAFAFYDKKSSEEGKIYMVACELEIREVSEKERIDAFGSRSKPK